MMFMIVNYCSDLGMVVVSGLRFVSYVICMCFVISLLSALYKVKRAMVVVDDAR